MSFYFQKIVQKQVINISDWSMAYSNIGSSTKEKQVNNFWKANSIYHLTNSQGGQAYYLPSYMRLHIESFCNLDLQSLTAEMHATLKFSFYYGPLPQHIVKQIISKMVLFFSKDNVLNLTQQNKQAQIHIDSTLHMVNISIRKLFHLRISSDIFFSPFQILNLMFSVQVKSVNIQWPQNNPSEVKINFNLMDVHPDLKNMKISFSDGIQFGNYNLAENYRSVEYTNQKHPTKIREELGLNLSENNKHHFKYAHFTIPLYKKPFSTLTTIFLPMLLLAVINLGTFYQDYILHDRIGNIANALVAFVALIPTIREQMPPSPSIALIEILVYIEACTACLCLIQSLIVRDMDQSVDPLLWSQYFLFYLALALAIIGFLPVIALSIIHVCYWQVRYNSLQSAEIKVKFSPLLWNKYDDDALYQSQTGAPQFQRHYFWSWVQKYAREGSIKRVIPIFIDKDYTRATIPLNIATLNFSTIMLSPFQFYSLGQTYYTEAELSRKFIENMKENQYLQNKQGGPQNLKRKINIKEFKWNISDIDKLYQKQRYCPLYDDKVGIEYHKLISEQDFYQKWDEKWKSIENNRIKGQDTVIERTRIFDWLCYKTLVEVFCTKIANTFEQAIDEKNNKQSIKEYKSQMKQFFQKQYLNDDRKYKMLIEGLQKHQIDILFLQEIRNTVKKYIPTKNYQLIFSIDGWEQCAIIVKKEIISNMRTHEEVKKQLSKLGVFQDNDQYPLRGSAVAIVNNLMLISCHIGSRGSPNTIEKKKTLIKYLRVITQKQQGSGYSFIMGVNSGIDFECSPDGVLRQQIGSIAYVFPNQSNDQPTTKKIRTSMQAQTKKAERVVEQCNDHLLSNYELTNQAIVTIKGQISRNILSLPFDQHPYDHFLVSANLNAANTFELVIKTFQESAIRGTMKHLVELMNIK